MAIVQPTEYPLVNGVRYDFSSLTIVLNTKRVLGCSEVNYKQTLEPGVGYGTHPQALFDTRGQLKVEASCTLYRDEFDDLIQTLGNGFLEKRFDFLVHYQEDPRPMKTDTIRRAKMKGPEFGGSAGSDPLEVKVDLHVILPILINGINPLLKPLPG
jgi:hypothetical protein